MARYNYFDDDDEIERELNSEKAPRLSIPEAVRGYISSSHIVSTESRKKGVVTVLLLLLVVLIFACFILIQSHSIHNRSKQDSEFCKDAAKVCINYIKEYGVVKWEALDASKYGENQAALTGLCYARQMDFNNDGSDELMLCYNSDNVYYLEVWGYSGKKFTQLYSHEANSTKKAKDGSWVGFYHRGGKYYICRSKKESPDKVSLYELKGDKFRKINKRIEYDYEGDLYSVNGDVNTSDFETIKLSVFRKSKGDVIVYQVTKNIDGFGNVLSDKNLINKSEAQLKAEAYYDIISKREEKYGKAKIKTENDLTYIDGLAVVRLIDFDGDGNDELLLGYRKIKSKSKYDNYSGQNIYYEVPVYSMDVYCWSGGIAKRILSKDTTSGYLSDNNVFYILLKNNEKTVDVCSNTYTYENAYSYTASSKIYKLKKQKFEASYNAKLVDNYGYRRYYIDNESVYSSTFDQKGHNVPLFMNDKGTVNADKYDIIYMSGAHKKDYQATVDKTVETIKSIKPGYTSAADEK